MTRELFVVEKIIHQSVGLTAFQGKELGQSLE